MGMSLKNSYGKDTKLANLFSQKPYLQSKLTYTDNTLLDEEGNAVMMDWEKIIMKAQAKTVCRNGGLVINIGFGMGYIDTYIQEHNPTQHIIIEPHPDVWAKMETDGWFEKPNVVCMFGKWQDFFDGFYASGIKFDGIYYDTWDEEQEPFNAIVQNFVKPDGVYTFFNNHRELGQKMLPYSTLMFSEFFDVEFESFEIGEIPQQHKDGRNYWDPKLTTYHNPILTLKKQ